MADKFINKVVYGGETLIDLTADRVISDTMLEYAVVGDGYKYYDDPSEYEGDRDDLAEVEVVVDISGGEISKETKWILRNSAHTASGQRVYGSVVSYEGGDKTLIRQPEGESEDTVYNLTFNAPEGYYLGGIAINESLGKFTEPATDTTAAGSAQILDKHSAWVDGKLVKGAIKSIKGDIALTNDKPSNSDVAGNYIDAGVVVKALQDTAARTVVPLKGVSQTIIANDDNDNAFLKSVVVEEIPYKRVPNAFEGDTVYIGCYNVDVTNDANNANIKKVPHIKLHDTIYSNAGATWAEFKANYPDIADDSWLGSGSDPITMGGGSSITLTLKDSKGVTQTWNTTLVDEENYTFVG